MLAKYQSSEKGFTLIELLIVVAIIGILAAIAIPQFAKYKEQGYYASMQSDAKSVATAEEAYFASNGSYKAQTSATSSPTTLGLSGVKSFSAGNSIAVKVNAGPPQTFVVTVTSGKVPTGSSVVYNSTTGSLTTTRK